MAEENTAVGEQVTEVVEGGEKETLTFTQSELDSYTDKKINKALETKTAKMLEEFEQKRKESEDKAVKLAQMSESERLNAQIAERELEVEKRENEIKLQEYRLQAETELSNLDLPKSLVSLVLSDDVETTQNNITELSTAVDNIVNSRIKELAQQEPPKGSKTTVTSSTTQKDLMKFAHESRII